MNKLYINLCLLLALVFNANASQQRKVLIIGLDGVRSDALRIASTPNIESLIASGFFTWDAWHCGITVSGPSWSTIMCGVWWNKHGVSSNAYTGSDYNRYPYFITRAKEVLPNLKCVQVVEWAPMSDNVYNDSWDLKLKTPDGDGAATAAVASAQLADPDLDALFVYFDQVDLTGHSSGFSPTNPSYMQSIENVDQHVGTVLQALYARPTYNSEDWLILLITDHGGIGTGHGGITYEERHIWWIASGSNIVPQQITAADPGTYNLLGSGIFNRGGVDQAVLKQSPVQSDIAVTALHHLIYETGINPESRTDWDFDGKSWLSRFTGVNSEEIGKARLYPNPVSNWLTIESIETSDKLATIKIFDITGRMILEQKESAGKGSMTIDVSHLPKGMYQLMVEFEHEVKSATFAKM